MVATEDRRAQLAAAMNRRRAELRIRWEDVARRGGVSVATLRRARNGKGELTLDTIVGIERGLEWNSGRVESILAHGDDTPAHDALPPAPPDIDPKEWASWGPLGREMVLDAIKLAGKRSARKNTRTSDSERVEV